MNERENIESLISREDIKQKLQQELSEIIDVSILGYKIDFISSEYYTIDSNLIGTPYEPEQKYIIDGNIDSREIVVPKNVLRTTEMLRPTKPHIGNYLKLLDQMGCQKVFFQPYVDLMGYLTLYRHGAKGGLIVRIGDVK